MTILVTGCAGFIGSNFVRYWLSNFNENVINLDSLTYAGNPANLTEFSADVRYFFVRGSIVDQYLVAGLLSAYRPRAILNFAAESHVDRSLRSPGSFVETNIVGAFHLLEAARGYWEGLTTTEKGIFRFLQISSDEVYGSLEADALPIGESTAYKPSSPYSASKASADHLVRAWHLTYGLPVLTTNCSNNYGPYQFPEKLIPLVIINAHAGKQLPVYGDGLQIRDWLYVVDHCRAIRRVLEAGRIGETYNVGGRNERTNISVVKSICLVLDELSPRADGKSYVEQISYVPDRPGHDRRYAIDSTKIELELGWCPNETFESGIRKTVIWYLTNQSWVNDIASGAYRALTS